RKNRVVERAAKGAKRMCSTPRGITGKIAGLPLRSKARVWSAQRLAASQEKSLLMFSQFFFVPLVLNASRHHRKNRPIIRNTAIYRSTLCSTPRGITGKIAFTLLALLLLLARAQRLAASQEKSQSKLTSELSGILKCS